MNEEAKYHVKIIRRQFDQTSDDWHATVTRLSDGMELIFINYLKWFLKLRTRRFFLDREFAYHDKREAEVDQIEEIVR